MYSDKIKRNCKKVHTGLKGSTNLTIIQSVEGQLSDGMWENSPAMEGYWLFECAGLENDEVVLYISNEIYDMWCQKWKYNKFAGKSETWIKEWFANKIKQIIKQEIVDWKTPGMNWKRNCTTESCYMHDGVTVQDCYRAYDQLKSRGDIYWFGKE